MGTNFQWQTGIGGHNANGRPPIGVTDSMSRGIARKQLHQAPTAILEALYECNHGIVGKMFEEWILILLLT